MVDKVHKSLQTYKSLEEGPATLEQRSTIMKQLMIDLTIFENIPPCIQIDKRECVIARKYWNLPNCCWNFDLTNIFAALICIGEVYEFATFLAVEKKNIEEFERNICVLKSYYDEFDSIIGVSSKKNSILGLYLLYLLSFNKISQYHTEIELISQEDIENNIYIQVPVSLETYFVQGRYQKILQQQDNVPQAAYYFFIGKFVDAIRYEIARSAERSYDSLRLRDMQKMFMIDEEAKLMAFIA